MHLKLSRKLLVVRVSFQRWFEVLPNRELLLRGEPLPAERLCQGTNSSRGCDQLWVVDGLDHPLIFLTEAVTECGLDLEGLLHLEIFDLEDVDSEALLGFGVFEFGKALLEPRIFLFKQLQLYIALAIVLLPLCFQLFS